MTVKRTQCLSAWLAAAVSNSPSGITARMRVRDSTMLLPGQRLTVFYAEDKFVCSSCTAKKVQPPSVVNRPHTYLHHLIRCSQKEDDATERSTDERVVTVESTVADLDNKVAAIEKQVAKVDFKLDDKLDPVATRVNSLDEKADSLNERLSRLEAYMERIEGMLGRLTAPQNI